MRRLLLVHLVLWASLATAHPAVADYPSARTVARRQATPPDPTSSYDYWWPYPAWGASTITTPTMSSFGPLDSLPVTSPTVLPSVILSSPVFSHTASLPGSNLVAVDSTFATSSFLPSATVQPTTTTLSSATVTTITALPPRVDPSRHYRQSRASPFRPGYLAGIFAVVGAIVGFAFSWILLAILRKCAFRREKSLVAGAPYCAPPEPDRTNSTTSNFHNRVSRFLGVPPPESQAMLTGGADVGRQGSWLRRAFTSHKREGARSRADSAAQVAADVEESFAGEEDAFLAPTSRGHTPARKPSSRRERTVERARSTAERNLQSPDELEEDEELDNAPFDTLRHKSIRRGILGRINEGSRYRKGHKRVESDAKLDDIRGSEGGESVLTAAFRSPVAAPPETPARYPLPVPSPSVSGPGFRIIEEDTNADTYHSQPSSRPGRSFRRSTASPTKALPRDNYTALPTRSLSPGKNRGAGMAESVPSPMRTRYPKMPLPRVDSSALPSSPPMVTSPPLEAQLFFGSSPNFGSAPRLDFTVSNDGMYKQTTSKEQGDRSPTKDKDQHTNKLHTRRDPPHLPYPSSPEFSQPKHLTKNVPPTLQRGRSRGSQGALNASKSPATTPAQRYALRHSAINKVDEILAQSWSARELRGEECPGSPTMFGAIAQEPGKRTAGGIEQRLRQARA